MMWATLPCSPPTTGLLSGNCRQLAASRIGGVRTTAACDAAEFHAADLLVILLNHPDLPCDEIGELARLVFDAKGCTRDLSFCGELL
jgi:UDP-N-acetyl-D-mannosaminuronate dehydrogenase